ncbi:TIGR04282 family arsenosugar biosynthesis glycosyltransferase [Microbacterium hydrocarbonoxydans]|uniref:TIGR04282 family arsenosugar biosynthesis glycosyltransferase n=1 Tax=Microbacterium hydrocarbonoxydans TaxID=273678 RepID=UPI0007BBFA6E|nr:DUF2064 domain-containing protein [Microbacterium hydrocarbonoxydans]GAT71628.1 hypothetical protein MHM582_0092 [Microbacterium sp. HM58-2]
MSAPVTVIVMAKECVPGRVKTRLHPPFTLEEAAGLAAASLADTLDAVAGTGLPAVLCVQGEVAAPAGMRAVPQAEGPLDERIAAAVDACAGRVLLIGMDTPQVDPRMLRRIADEWPDDVDAWFGPASDGGFWLLGLGDARPGLPGRRGDLVRGVPMSRSDTGRVQRRRLIDAGLRVADAPALTDVDDLASLRTVGPLLPVRSRLARLLAESAALSETGGAS